MTEPEIIQLLKALVKSADRRKLDRQEKAWLKELESELKTIQNFITTYKTKDKK